MCGILFTRLTEIWGVPVRQQKSKSRGYCCGFCMVGVPGLEPGTFTLSV